MSEPRRIKQDNCPHCDGPRQSIVYENGMAAVSLTTSCKHREQCEQEIQPGFRSAPSQ